MTGNMKNKIGNECCGAQTLTSSNVCQLPGVFASQVGTNTKFIKRNQVQQVDGIKAIKSKSIAAFSQLRMEAQRATIGDGGERTLSVGSVGTNSQ